MCITNIAGHGRDANERIRGKGDILQRKTVTPIVPCYHQDQATYQKSVEHVQPLHWIFTYYGRTEHEIGIKKVQVDVHPISSP